MNQLIKVQFYRMKKSCMRIWLLPACLASVLLPVIYTWYTDNHQSDGSMAFDFPHALEAVNASYMFFFCALVMFVLAWSMRGSFDDHTICNEFMAGYSIPQIIVSRLIVLVGASLIVSMLCMVLVLTAVWVRYGVIEGSYSSAYYEFMTASELWKNVLMAVFEILEASVLLVLSMCIARETTSALAICWMVYMFSWLGVTFAGTLFDMNGKVRSMVVSVLPGLAPQLSGLVDDAPLKSIGERLPLVIGAGIIWMAVFYVLAVWLLKTFELRGNDDD